MHVSTAESLPIAQRSRVEDCLAGGGEMGARMRGVDWSQTPLGPVATWPQSLRTAVSMMLDSRFAMVIAWGDDFRFFYNDRYISVLGDKHPRALGTPAVEIFPEVWHLIGPEFERALRGEPFATEDWYLPIDRNGHYRENCWFTVSYSGIRDESGGIGGLLLVVAETTERVEGERRMATLRELAGAAAAARTPTQACRNAAAAFARNSIDVPFALLYGLEDGGQTARLLGSTGLADDHVAAPATIDLAAPSAGWPLGSLIEPFVVEDLAARFGELPGGAAPEPTRSAVVLPLARPGLEHPHGVLIAGVCPRRSLDDRYRGFFELAADHIATAIGNAHAIEEQRRRAEALAEIDRVKTAFFSNVSHEFRTPLALMLGPLEDLIAGRHGEVAPALAEQHVLIHRNGLRLLKLVNTMLDFSRIEAGRARAVYEPTDLAAYTVELASMFRAAIERAGLELVVDCPPLSEPVFVDRGMWEKIVLNLISNAFKFTFEGRIEVRLRAAGELVELAVRDTGTGIAADELPRLFERFHRVEGARSRTHEGSGIGLALANELARLHGGTIDAASEVGAGSTFTVRIRSGQGHLPRDHISATPSNGARAFVAEAQRWLPAEVDEAPAATTSTARVLVADDNADMRDYVRGILARRWQVTAVGDGEAALAQIRRAPPDVVVTDVMMPGLDGFGLLAALRADPATRGIPVIVVSARAGDEARVEGLEAGADDYVVKPFAAQELVARVATQLAAAEVRRELEIARRGAEQRVDNAERFTAILGHDLRNPLNAIATAAQLLQRRATTADISRPAGRIVLSAERMARMIDQLLELARVRAFGTFSLQRKPIDLGDLSQLVVDELRQAYPGAAIELGTTGALHGRWDGDRLARLLSNLVGNAIEHGRPRSPVRVELDGRDPACVSMRVENHGEIPEDVLPVLFDPFRSSRHRSDKSRGLGLGLFISQQIVVAHGGTIGVRSSREDGTCFDIVLPKTLEAAT